MKIPNRQELQQITITHSSHVKFKDFMRLYIKCTAKPYSFLVIYANLPSDNTSLFRKIKDEKFQYDINCAAAKISALSS